MTYEEFKQLPPPACGGRVRVGGRLAFVTRSEWNGHEFNITSVDVTFVDPVVKRRRFRDGVVDVIQAAPESATVDLAELSPA